MELKDLTPEQLNELKNAFDSAILSLIKEAQDELLFIKTEAETLRKQERELWEKQRLAVYPESSAIMEQRMVLDKKIVELQNKILNQENIVFCLENGGMISAVTDKKGKEHTQIPDFRSVNTNQIYFDLETILTDKKPVYVPNIDEDNFRRRGYVFDAIRLDKDSYILAIKKHSEEEHTDYVLVTLDQLVLISDYYYTKAKAILLKEAQDKNKRSEEYWDKLPEEKRERFLNQKNLYHSLPVKVKKEITQENYEALDWKEKEKLYKFYKRYGSKKIVSKLGATEMWVSFHSMYERFIDPTAVQPKKGYGNEIVFAYWYAFSEMMKYKINDIQIQRDDLSEMRKIALETSYGESNTSDVLKQEFGILVKRQNGDKINPMEIDQIKNAFASVQNIFGNLKNIAAKQNIKISHTGVRYCFASKAIGMYVPKMGTIAVSDKYGDVQFKMTLAHETGHFIDNYIGELNKKSYASNNYESTAGQIAFVFRDNMNKPKSKHNNYVNSTQECFARAMEQYYGIEAFGEDAGIAFSYVPLDKPRPFFVADDFIGKDAYYNKLKPLIIQFFTENEDIFKYTVDVNETNEPVPIGTENENTKNITEAIEVLTVLMELSTETQKQELQIKIDDLKGVLNSGSGSVFEKGGTIRRYNLPINDNYKLIDSFYTGGLENSTSCDNCGKPIANVATIKNTKGEIFNVGLDCAETLTHIDGLYNAKMDFEELKAIQAKIRKLEKEGKKLNYEINKNGDLSIIHDGYSILNKDIDFAKKYMPIYLKNVNNPEKIGFNYIDKNITIPFERFRPSENINFIKEWDIEEYHITVSVKPYFHMVTKQISGYDFYLDVDTNRKNIFSKRVTMYNNLPVDINYAIKSYLFDNYNNNNIFENGGETQNYLPFNRELIDEMLLHLDTKGEHSLVRKYKGIVSDSDISAIIGAWATSNKSLQDIADGIEERRSKYINRKIFEQGGETKLLAPNGQKSNLTPDQYKLVRTPAFINWFGDWINQPETASKVVDENGEPLVVYHGSRNEQEFNIFDSNKGNPTSQGGHYFSSDKNFAQKFGKNLRAFFLRIENPLRDGFDGSGAVMSPSPYRDGGIFTKRNTDRYAEKGIKEFIVFESNQIKLADGTNITFDNTNPDIRFEDGGEIYNEELKFLIEPINEIEFIGQEKGKYNPDGVSLYVNNSGSYRYVYSENGVPIAALQVMSRDGKNGVIANAYTIPLKRKQGVGRKLFNYAKNKFKTLKHSEFLSGSGKLFAENVFKNGGEITTNDDIKTVLLKRIPFLKDYNIFNHPRDKKRLEAQKVVYNENVKVMMGNDVLNFPQYNVSSEITYYPHVIGENTFHHFIIKNSFHAMQPKELDDLTFRVFIMAQKQLQEKLSYNKEIMLKTGDGIPKPELDKIINEMNGVLFEIEQFTEKHAINLFKNGGEITTNEDLYQEWKKLVNMSATELEKFKNTPEGKKAGLTKTKAKQLGISSGQESSEWILKMKNTDVKNWTPEMWKWATKQVAFIKRMSGVKGDLFDENNKKTRKHTSLLIWGNNPVKTKKLKKGGETKKTPEFTAESDFYFEYVPLEEIEKYKEFDRETQIRFDKSELDNLTKIIAEKGITHPITLQVYGNYGIIPEGNHRIAAAKRLGIKNIPVKVEVRTKPFKGTIYEQKVVKLPRKKDINELKVWYPEIKLLNIDNSAAYYGFTKTN